MTNSVRQPTARVDAALPMFWMQGHCFEPGAHPCISPLDRGFTLADGLFETMRMVGGVIFRLDRHLVRLAAGARVLAIALDTDRVRVGVDAMLSAAHLAGVADAALRLTVSRGVGGSGIAPNMDALPTIVVAMLPMPEFSNATYTSGLSARLTRGRRNEFAVTCGVKTLAYTEAVIALSEATASGDDDGILLDSEGHVSEATTSNVFLWRDDVLVTPPRSCGALPGITREAVLELASMLGLPAAERLIEVSDLRGADEAFLTSSLRGIAPLVRIDGHPVGNGTVGTVTRRLMDAYAALVAREVAA